MISNRALYYNDFDFSRIKNNVTPTNSLVLTWCEPERGTPRKTHQDFVDSDNTSPIEPPPLSKEKLKHLLDLIINVVSQLPDDNTKTGYDE